MSFKVSDKVVRVAPIINSDKYIHHGPLMRVRGVYVVRWIGVEIFKTGIQPAIKLVGMQEDHIASGSIDVPYCAKFFRKLEDIKQLNKIYREMYEEAWVNMPLE